MSNKEVIQQEIISYEAVYKVSKTLDQFVDGLKHLGILKIIRAFPELFAQLFTYNAELTYTNVVEAIFLEECDALVPLSHLYSFLNEADEEGKVLHINVLYPFLRLSTLFLLRGTILWWLALAKKCYLS